MTCKTCKHLAVAPNKAGKVIVKSDRTYPCVAPDLEPPILPYCVSALRSIINLHWPPLRVWMYGDSGEGCPTYQPRSKQ